MQQGYPAPTDQDFRRSDASLLARALGASRADTLATFAAVERARAALTVPERDTLNPPLWELGHVGWFQEYWIARNPQRTRGVSADPDAARTASGRPDADALYDSGRVAHPTRWSLPLPDAAGTRADLARQLDGTIACLSDADHDDDALYFFRLALAHEDMHHEAALYMARSLGIAIDDPRWQATSLDASNPQLPMQSAAQWATNAGAWPTGQRGAGFQFDNEVGPHAIALTATSIDSRVVRWAEYLVFVEAGGYRDRAWWTEAGNAWRAATSADAPRYLRRTDGGWETDRHGRWSALDPTEAAVHLTRHEADAFCRWAGRRLPTEHEWEFAAHGHRADFRWGDVWEWTASPFAPYPGFVAHPYRDYSAPWFGSRTVLRGASHLTQPRMRHPCYRNFFAAERNDVPAGFRTCAP